MPIENYSADDIKAVLNAFGIQDTPYSVGQQTPQHFYYRMVPDVYHIDLLQDIIEYLHKILLCKTTPSAERRVAFIFENSVGRFSVVVHYRNFNFEKAQQLITRKGWDIELPIVAGMWHKDPRRILETIYSRIELYCLIPPNQQIMLEPFLSSLSDRIKLCIVPPNYHPIFEHPHSYKGVSFTESIRQLLLEDTLNPFIMFVEALGKHKKQCAEQLMQYFLVKKNNPESKKIIELLGILMKYTQLQTRREMLQHIPMLDILLAEDEKWQKIFFALPLGDLSILLENLPMGVLSQLLILRDEPKALLQCLQQQKALQMQMIMQWESERRQYLPHSSPLSWRERSMQQAQAVCSYLWQRSPTSTFQALGRFIMHEFSDRLVEYPTWTTAIEYLLKMVLRSVAILVRCIPEHFRPAVQDVEQLSLEERNAQLGSTMGLIIGFMSTYYGGVFELLFSYSLIFIIEVMHSQLMRERVDVSSAQFHSIQKYVSTLSNLLRINMLFLLTLIMLYTNDIYYFKRGLSAIALSEAARRLFIWLSRDDDFPPEAKNCFEFIFSLSGSWLGTFLFNSYHSIQARFDARENAIARFTELAKEYDPTLNYIRSEALGFFLIPCH